MPIAVKIAVVTACALVAMGTILWVIRRNSKAKLALAGKEGRVKGSPHHMSKKSSGSVEVLSNPAPGPRLTATTSNKQKALVQMTGEVIEGGAPLEEGKKPGFWMRTGSGATSSKPVVAAPARVERPREPAPAPSPAPEPVDEDNQSNTAPVTAANPVASLAATSLAPSTGEPAPTVVRPNPLAVDATQSGPVAAAPVAASPAWSLAADATTNVPITRDNRFSAPSVASLTQPLAEESPPAPRNPSTLAAPPVEPTPAVAFAATLAAAPIGLSPTPTTPVVESAVDSLAHESEVNELVEQEVEESTESLPVLEGSSHDSVDSLDAESTGAPNATESVSPDRSGSEDAFVFYDDDDDGPESASNDVEFVVPSEEEIDFREDVIRIHVRIDEHGVQQITTMDMSSGAQQWTDKEIKKSNGSKGKKKKKKSKKK